MAISCKSEAQCYEMLFIFLRFTVKNITFYFYFRGDCHVGAIAPPRNDMVVGGWLHRFGDTSNSNLSVFAVHNSTCNSPAGQL